MCCAQTAAPDGVKNSPRKCKCAVTTSTKTSCTKSRKPSKIQPGTSPDPPKWRLERSLGAKICPRGPQERLKRAQELPTKRPRGALRSNSMCCACTAALQGGYEKQKVNASRDFLQQSVHNVQQSQERYAKNAFCSRVRHVPKFIKHRKNCGFVA